MTDAMPGRDEPDGGRGNGLFALSYETLTDLDAALALAMLEVFREEGVAARISVSSPASRTGQRRLWVDAAELDLARAVLDTRLPMLRAEQRAHRMRSSELRQERDETGQNSSRGRSAPPEGGDVDAGAAGTSQSDTSDSGHERDGASDAEDRDDAAERGHSAGPTDADASDRADTEAATGAETAGSGRDAEPNEPTASPGFQLDSRREQEIWEELVASFNEPSAGTTHDWPERENLSDGEDPPRADSDTDPPGRGDAPEEDGREGPREDASGEPSGGTSTLEPRPAPPVNPMPPLNSTPRRPPRSGSDGTGDTTSGTGRGPRDWSPEEPEEDEHYVPPTPPPLPSMDTTTKLAWVAALGGPTFLVVAALLRPDYLKGWPAALSVLLFLGGFVTLVTRLKDRDDDDDDPHGGAVV